MHRAKPKSEIRQALTLVEVAATMVVTSVVVVSAVGMVHAMSHTGRTLSTVSNQRSATALAMMRMRRELRLAKTVSVLTANDVVFTHPDITGDSSDETLRYTWSGTAGAPLTRTLNGGAAQILVAACNDLTLKAEVDVTLVPPLPTETPEAIIASFNGYTLPLVFTSGGGSLSTTRFQAETFTPTYAGATSLRITKAELSLRKSGASPTGNALVSIRPLQANNLDPAATMIAEASRPVTSLQTVFQYEPFTFTNCTGLTPGTKYAVVARTDNSSIYSQWEFQQLTVSSLDNGVIFRTTTNGGSLWTPTSGFHATDLRFKIYGIFQLPAQAPAGTIASGTLNMVTIRLESVEGASLIPLQGGVECVNRPDLAGKNINDLSVI